MNADIAKAIEAFEAGMFGEFTLGFELAKAQPGTNEYEWVSLVHNYFAATPENRLKLSSHIHECGFSFEDRVKIQRAWNRLGGTAELFEAKTVLASFKDDEITPQ